MRSLWAYRIRAHERGFVETVFGGVFICPKSTPAMVSAVRVQNAPRSTHRCRGVLRILSKRAMLVADNWIQRKPPLRMIMQVHDELVFEVERSFLARPKSG